MSYDIHVISINIYDKLDDFAFGIINFPFGDGDISQLISQKHLVK